MEQPDRTAEQEAEAEGGTIRRVLFTRKPRREGNHGVFGDATEHQACHCLCPSSAPGKVGALSFLCLGCEHEAHLRKAAEAWPAPAEPAEGHGRRQHCIRT